MISDEFESALQEISRASDDGDAKRASLLILHLFLDLVDSGEVAGDILPAESIDKIRELVSEEDSDYWSRLSDNTFAEVYSELED